MASEAWIMGGVPFYRGRAFTNRYLVPDSVKASSGQAAMCWGHWLDNSHVFTHPASWFKTEAGLVVLGRLHLAHPIERRAYELVKSGAAFLSSGVGATPQENAQLIARWEKIGYPAQNARLAANPDPDPEPYGELVIGHWSIGDSCAFPQSPIDLLIEV